MKIKDDKYYTSDYLAKNLTKKAVEIIGLDNISEFLEPSAGNGVFLKYLPKSYLAYDILPESPEIIKGNFLDIDLNYKKGRCIIGNPPFGERNNLVIKFYKKSINLADYICFILPISQLNNNYSLYEFDLIYSEDLSIKEYSGIPIHCCFNIFERPERGFNKKPNYKLKDIEIKEYRRNNNNSNNNIFLDFDIGICSFGKGIIGKIPSRRGEYAKEFYFKINNQEKKEEILNLIKNTDWEKEVCKGSSGQLNLAQWQIYKYLKDKIQGLT